MKKIVALLLAILLILSTSVTVFAYDAESKENTEEQLPSMEQFSLNEITRADYIATNRSATPYATHYFSLDNTTANAIISDFIEYEIQEGETAYLTISSCMWSPHTCDVRIGFYNLDTGYAWYFTFSGGSCSGTYSFPNMPEGRYMVYVRNVSSSTITDGSIRYSVS